MKKRSNTKVSTMDIYKGYKKTHPKYKTKLNDFRDISQGFTSILREELLEEGSIALPHRLGTMKIVGRTVVPKVNDEGQITNLPVDWQSTKELWNKSPKAKLEKQLVYHFNEHTQYVRYKLGWYRKNVFLKNKNFYYFDACRDLKRQIAKEIKNNKEYTIAD